VIVGIDATPAVRTQLTGTEIYARSIIDALATIRGTRTMRLYANAVEAPAWLPAGIEWRGIPFPRLWTHWRLRQALRRERPARGGAAKTQTGVILIDSSVWIDHFRSESPSLGTLDLAEVITHPFVIGELACGTLRHRRDVLHLFSRLPQATIASHEEVLLFIEERRLMGKGIGYIDAHLLTAVSLTEGARLWTHDKHLAALAADLHLGLSRN